MSYNYNSYGFGVTDRSRTKLSRLIASTEVREVQQVKEKEEKIADERAVIAKALIQQFNLIVDERIHDIVKPGIKGLANQTAKLVKDRSYDELSKAVAKVRPKLDELNEAAEIIFGFLDKH